MNQVMIEQQRWWVVALLVLVAVLIHLLQPILMPFLIGALLAYLGDPVADKLESFGLGRTLAVCIVFLLLLLLLILSLVLTLPLIGQQLDLLAQKLPEWLHQFQQVAIPWLQQRFDLPEGSLPVAKFKEVLKENWGGAGNVLTIIWQRVSGSGIALMVWLANMVLIPVVFFYLLRDWDVLIAHIQDSIPRRYEKTASLLAKECDEIVGAFIRGQLIVMLVLGVVYSVGLSIVGLDMALLLGVLAGLASVVPYMGFIVGIVAASIAAFFQFHEWLPLLWVGLVFGFGQLLEGMLLTPVLVGDRIGLHPVAVIFAILAGGQLAGFTGVLLALPVAAVIMVLLRHLHRNYKNSSLYGAEESSS